MVPIAMLVKKDGGGFLGKIQYYAVLQMLSFRCLCNLSKYQEDIGKHRPGLQEKNLG